MHIHVFNKLIIKILHHAINITSSKAEFFAIRCSINQVIYLHGISKIIVVTDSIHVAKRSLILHLTHSKSIWLSSSMTLESFLLVIKRTRLNFENAQAKANGTFKKELT